MARRIKSLTFLPIFLALFAFPAPAQEEEVPIKTRIQDELEFAMVLARYRYFDLANDFVSEIKKNRMTDQEEATLLLTNAQILRWAAEFSTTRADRHSFYQQAIAQFRDFIEYNTDHPDYNKARSDLALLYQSHGQFLTVELNAISDDQRRGELREQAEASFRECTLLFNEVARDLRKQSEVYKSEEEEYLADKSLRQANEAEYKKGVAYYSWAQIYGKDDFNREDYLQRTIDTLDEYIWEAREDDFWALWAYLYQAMAYTEKGDFTQALDLAMQVYNPETGIAIEDTEKGKLAEDVARLAPEYQKMITDLVESSFLQVAKIHNLQGNYENAVSTVNQLKGMFERCGLELSPLGFKARLEEAQAHFKLGNATLAAQVAQEVADMNSGNEVGNEAKAFINDMIKFTEAGPTGAESGLVLSPDILFTAAEGAFLERKYLQAIDGYYKVFKTLKTVELQKEYEAKVWNSIGKCYNNLFRPLEASIAFKTGFYSQYAKADEDMYENNGNNWYMAAGKRFKETNHPFDEAIMKSSRETLVTAGVSTDLLYFIAKEKFDKAQLAEGDERISLMNEAIESFLDVKKTSQFYEKSLIYLARCYQDLGQYAEALKRLDEFESYVRTSPPPATAKQKGARQGAMAEALFYRAEIYLVQEKYKEAYDLLEGFEDTFKTQQGFFAAILYFRILAKLGLGEFPAAESIFKEMEEKQSASNRFVVAAYRIGKAFVDAADKERGAPEEEPTQKYLDLLRKGADYMYRYCEMSGFDSFTNLKNVADWYKALKDFPTSGQVYQRLLDEYAKNAEYKTEIETTVFRDYGEVLLELKDFQKAKPIWLRLLNADKKNPTLLHQTARCLGGWLEWDGDNYIEIPGAGDYIPPEDIDSEKIRLDNALDIWRYLLKALGVNKAYEPEWWEAKLYTIYCYYMAGEQNRDCYDTALKLIQNAELYHPDLGGADMKRAFKYLERNIKSRSR